MAERKKRPVMTQADYVARASAVINEKIKQTTLLRESRDTFTAESDRRGNAEQYTQAGSKVFLNPKDIQQGLQVGFKDVYWTSLGGVLRPMTEEDLKVIERNIQVVQKQYAKGITAKNVLDFSLLADKQRCNKQIHLCVPLSLKGNVVRFMVNASGENGVAYHYINVQFEQMPSAIMATTFDRKTANNVSYGKLRFECSCEHHKYTFRYLATIAGYNYGREEQAFPKIRNPTLSGVACKHVLRVMQYIRSAMFQEYLFKAVEKQRKQAVSSNTQKTSEKRLKAKVDALLEKGLKNLKHDENLAIKQMKKLNNKLSRKLQAQAQKEHDAKMKKIARQHGEPTAKRIAEQQRKALQDTQRETLASMGLTPQQIDNFLRNGTFDSTKGKKS